MDTLHITHIDLPGKTLACTIERVSDGFVFNGTVFVDPVGGILYSQKRIPLIEGSFENQGSYTPGSGGISNVSGALGNTDPGLVRIRIHDELNSNTTIACYEGHVVGGALVRGDAFVSTRSTPADVFAQIVRALSDSTTGMRMDELSQIPPKNPTLAQALMLLFMQLRNKDEATNSVQRIYNDNGDPVFERALSDDSVTSVRGKLTGTTT